MSAYSIKIVNHTRITPRLQGVIKTGLQNLFDQVFSGTVDSAVVDWGTGAASDAIVLHFVHDIATSYLQQQMPGNNIRGDAGGHTRTQGKITGSEFYLRTSGTPLHDSAYARLAFHESLHNQFPFWSNDDMHGADGGGGLASSPPQEPMTEKNKELMRRGIAIKNAQLM
ncbi:MAG: hypothetical protein ABI999_13290 [Acidobacteriota bacterium]